MRRGRSRACFCQAATRAAALIQYNTVERVEMRGSESKGESRREQLTLAVASVSERERGRERIWYDSKMLCVSVSNRLDLYAPSPSWKTQQTARGRVRFSSVCFARALLLASPLFSSPFPPLLLLLSLPFSPVLYLFLSRVLFRSYSDRDASMWKLMELKLQK